MARTRLPVLLLLFASLAGCSGGSATVTRQEPPTSASPTTSAPPAPSVARPCGTRTSPPTTYDHVVWIVLENHSYGRLVGRPGSTVQRRSPYLNALARSCGLATRYYALTHPSLPNYLALVSGRTGGVRRSCPPARCPQDRSTLLGRVRSWGIYAESMPTACRRGDAGRYVVRHNPATYFRGLASTCRTRDLPLGTRRAGALATALDQDRLPRFAIVVPDQCNNTHDCPIGTGDRWLSRWVPRILASPAYRAGRTALVVTWDEGAGGFAGQDCLARPDQSCHVVTVLVSPSTRPGTRSAIRFDHYSLLETTQRMLGVRPLLGHAADARTRSMRAAFRL